MPKDAPPSGGAALELPCKSTNVAGPRPTCAAHACARRCRHSSLAYPGSRRKIVWQPGGLIPISSSTRIVSSMLVGSISRASAKALNNSWGRTSVEPEPGVGQAQRVPQILGSGRGDPAAPDPRTAVTEIESILVHVQPLPGAAFNASTSSGVAPTRCVRCRAIRAGWNARSGPRSRRWPSSPYECRPHPAG
jgi:hypothetical protein